MTDTRSDSGTAVPCPFCGNPLTQKRGKINPYARCETEDCFGSRCPVVNLDDPRALAAWNTRAFAQTVVPARYWEDMYTDLLKRVDAGEFSGIAYNSQDPLAGLHERLDRVLLTATDNSRFILSTESAKNIVGIVRAWLRSKGAAIPSTDQVCAGGIDPGFEECPKCGATMDDACAFSSTDRGTP